MSEETKTTNEVTESMKDFEEEINKSFQRLREGDIINCTVLAVNEQEVLVDIGSYSEGSIAASEVSDDPSFSLRTDVTVGDTWKALVLQEDDGEGHAVLSKKRADSYVAWDKLREAKENETVYAVKLTSSVNAGMIGYVEGLRAFIPASQLALHYVENLEEWVNKTVDAIVITVDEEHNKLVLSAKAVARRVEEEKHEEELSHLQKGLVTTGVVETIMPYGAFVNIGNGLTGLVHISQICGRHIKSPNEVVKEGQEVKVKVLDVVDGKIKLSMKAIEENEMVVDEVESAPVEYISDESASTGLGSLLANLKL
ncbi:SSU ribosomal protein S1p [Lachnospiraceae bacterium KM106-2]|nr:SSU ribosomal protein S1p [Lachnospiraceae bacterium KM106-2]